MTTEIDSMWIVKPAKLEPGFYNGHWTGYIIRILQDDGSEYHLRTKFGVRGLDVPCRVEVKLDGSATAEAG